MQEAPMDERTDGKRRALREHGSLHPRPQDVHDPLFQHGGFFDPHDLVLVKYEMLRRVRVEGMSVTQAAKTFGFSRVTFYQALEAFRTEGLAGLLPRQRGPKRASKLTDDVLGLIDRLRTEAPGLRAPELAERVRRRLGLSVHPRSIERALARRAKGGRQTEPA
jgi:transposase